jgi:aquaporin Z
MNKLLAEAFGTFCLVFAGTGALIINQVAGGSAVTHVGIALTFGLVVLAMIYALGDISGCHINPAVTLGFVAARRMPIAKAGGYIAAQLVGALLASLLLRLLFPSNEGLGITVPAGEPDQFWRSLVLEGVLTFILMFVVISVSTGAKEKGITAGIAIGAVIALESLFAGPITGASMNPARSLAPALVTGKLGAVWIYIVGPIAGALLAVPFYSLLANRPANAPTPT